MSTLKVFSPYDRTMIEEIPMHSESDLHRMLSRAEQLFLDRREWIPKFRRIEILENIQQLMTDRKDVIIKTATLEGGKPLKDTQVEMVRAINGVKLAIQALGNLKGEEVPMGLTAASQNRMAFTFREPIGIVASISAFNHPINLIVHQAIPAIAVGSPVIIKPALTTPLTCLLLTELFREAGLPQGWCEPLICDNEVAEMLATSSRIGFMSFIGSAKVGWQLRSRLSPGTRCALEHGGAAPVIVEPDADINSMVPALVKGGFYHAGQVCVSVQRVFVHEAIQETVLEEMIRQTYEVITGDPMLESTGSGPLILPKEVDRVESWVQEAADLGGKILCGGKRISETCFEPTLILNPPDHARVSVNEVFGPVVCVYTYSDRQEAIQRANSIPYHFQAAVFTKNIDNAMECIYGLNASTVLVNDHTAFRVDWMPFAGRDQSGLGIGSIPHTMLDMSREKMLVIKSDRL